MLPRPSFPRPIRVVFVAITALALLLAASTYLLFFSDSISSGLEAALEKGFAQAGLTISIGGLDPGLGSSLRLTDVRIGLPNEAGDLVVPSTTIFFSWPKLIANLAHPVQALSGLHLVEPQVNLDYAALASLGDLNEGSLKSVLPKITARISNGSLNLANYQPGTDPLVTELATAAGIELSSGKLHFSPIDADISAGGSGTISVSADLSIPGAVLSPVQIRARYSPGSAWQAAVAVDNVDVADFREIARQYQSEITVQEGAVSATAYFSGKLGQPEIQWSADVWLHRINGTLTRWELPVQHLQGGLRVTPNRVDLIGLRANVDGEVLESSGAIKFGETVAANLRFTANRVDLSAHDKLWAKLIPTATLQHLNGQANFDLTVNGQIDSPIIAGTVDLAGVSAELYSPTSIEVAGLSGQIHFAGDQIWTDRILMRVAEQPLSLHGQVLLGSTPYFNLSASTQQLGLQRVVGWLDQHGLSSIIPGFLRSTGAAPIQGELSFSGTMLGTFQSPLIAGKIDLVNGRILRVPIDSLTAEFDYAAQALNLRSIILQLPQNQQIEGNTTIVRTNDKWGYSGIFRYTDLMPDWLEGVLPTLKLDFGQVGGRLSGEFVVEGGFGEPPTVLSGNLRLQEPRLAEHLFQTVSANWSWQQGILDIKYLEAVSKAGRLSLMGTYTGKSQAITAQVFGHDLQLDQLSTALAAVGVPVTYLNGISGTASARALVSGTLADPSFTGSVVVTDPSWRQERFDLLTAKLAYDDQVLSVQEAELSQGLARLTLSGQINRLITVPEVFLEAAIADVDAAKLQRFFNLDLPVEGIITADLRATGRWQEVQVLGPINVADGALLNIPVQAAAATLLYKKGLLEVSEVAARISDATLTGDGRYSQGQVEAAFQLSNVRLADLETLGLPIDGLKGKADFSGTLTGPVSDLSLTGKIDAEKIAFREYRIEGARGLFTYELASQRAEFDSIRLQQGETILQVRGAVALAELPTYDLNLSIAEGTITDLTKFVPNLAWPEVGGTVSGQIHLAGVGAEVDGRGTMNFSNLEYAGFTYDGSADLAYEDGVFKLYRGKLWDSIGEVTLAGSYQLGREFDFSASGTGISLAPIAAVLRPGMDIGGQAQFTAELSGTPQEPKGQVEFSISNGEAAGVSLDDCEGTVQFDTAGLRLSGVTITTGANKTVIEGSVPWPVTVARRVPVLAGDSADLNLRVQMADESLSLLSLVIGSPIDVKGQGQIDLTVSGTFDKPAVNGVVDLANLHLSLPGILPGSFDQVTAKIDFQGRRGIIRKAEGLYNGGSFTAEGSVGFEDPDNSLVDLKAKGSQIGLEFSVMKAKADADLTISGQLKKPLIKGSAVLSDAVFAFAQGNKKPGKPYTSQAQLDIHVTNKNDVRVLISNIVDARAIGEVTLGGTISNLTLSGQAELTRGTISYADTIFTLESATADFSPFRGVTPVIEALAETRVPEAIIQLSVSGPTDNLQLSLSSNPPMSEQEIVTKLSLPGRLTQLIQGARDGMWEEELIRLFDDQLSSQVMGGIESVIREALQLDEFRIRRAFSEENVQLQFGKYLIDSLYVTYTRTLDTENPLEYLGFEYRWKPNIILNNSISSDGEVRFGVETKLRF